MAQVDQWAGQIVAPGANAAVTPDDIFTAADAIRHADIVISQLETPVEAAMEAFRIARAAGVRTLLNPAPVLSLPEELLRLTDICVPNETELELLTGGSVPDFSVESAARALQKRGPQVVVVTLGAAGAMVLSETVERMPGLQVDAVDPTGAGDVFIGALAVSLAEGGELREAVRWANVAAAISVTRSDAQSAAPSRPEVEALFR